MAHLLPEQVVAARKYAALGWPIAEIARRFKCSRSTIDRVVKGQTHAPDPGPAGRSATAARAATRRPATAPPSAAPGAARDPRRDGLDSEDARR